MCLAQPDGSVKQMVMTVQTREHARDFQHRRTSRYVLTPDDLGPIDPVRRDRGLSECSAL